MSAPAPSPLAIVDAEPLPRQEEVLTDAALAFVAELHRRFTPRRDELLARRARAPRRDRPHLHARLPPRDGRDPRRRLLAGRPGPGRPERPPRRDHRSDRPQDDHQRPQLGRQVWLADFEDASAPTWENVVLGQLNLIDAYTRNIDFTDPKSRQVVRPASPPTSSPPSSCARAAGTWTSATSSSTASPVPGALVDFGLYFFHNAQRLIDLGKGPYFYLPKTESHLEARLWNDVFVFAQDYVGIPQGTVRATVLIETITAAYEMEEILYELRDHASGLNAGRWDYLFSIVKNFRDGGAEVRPAGPQRGDDDRPVHACVHRTPRPHLPQARRARHRRHGGLHPVPPRRRGQQGRLREGQGRQGPRGRRRLRRLLGRPPGPRPDRAWRPSTRSSATGRTRRTGCARTSRRRRPT